jgi:serine protease Do
VVTKIDDRAVSDARALRLMVGEMSPGKTVELAVLRDGMERRYSVALGEQPSGKGDPADVSSGASSLRALDGVVLEALTLESARQYGPAPNRKGVAVRRVDPDSAAAKAGLEAGDVILEVNRHPVTTAEDVKRYVNESPTGAALLFVSHDGQTRYLAIPTK